MGFSHLKVTVIGYNPIRTRKQGVNLKWWFYLTKKYGEGDAEVIALNNVSFQVKK